MRALLPTVTFFCCGMAGAALASPDTYFLGSGRDGTVTNPAPVTATGQVSGSIAAGSSTATFSAGAPIGAGAAPAFVAGSGIFAISGPSISTVTLPAGHAANDILLMSAMVRNSTATFTWPTGWTQLAIGTQGGAARYGVAWKRDSGAEPATLTVSHDALGSPNFYVFTTCYRGASRAANPWDVVGGGGTITTGNSDVATIPSITTLTANSLAIAFVTEEVDEAQTFSPASWTLNFTDTDPLGVNSGSHVFSRPMAVAGATGALAVDFAGTDAEGWGGIQLALRGEQWDAGDLLLFWQSSGGVNPISGDQTTIDLTATRSGQWELARIGSVNVGTRTVSLDGPFTKPFDALLTQAVRVPEYVDVTITNSHTAAVWSGSTGGAAALLATGTISLTGAGQIDASARGFRGGPKTDPTATGDTFGCTADDLLARDPGTGLGYAARKGEGLVAAAFGATTTAADDVASKNGRGNVGHGAGGGICGNSGGGGGGHGGTGGIGGLTWAGDGSRAVGGKGGAQLDYSLLDRAVMGGGGGAGQGNNTMSTAGGLGGGLIWMRAANLTAAANAPAWVSTGAITNDTDGNVNVPLPGVHQAGDVLLLAMMVEGNETITWPADWTELANFTRGANTRFALAWKRDNGAEAAPTVNVTGTNEIYGVMSSFRGARASGNPWQALSTTTGATTGAGTALLTGLTSTLPNTLLIETLSLENDNISMATPATTGVTWTERFENDFNGGTPDFGFQVSTATLTAAAVIPTTSVALGGAVGWGGVVLALSPASRITADGGDVPDCATGCAPGDGAGGGGAGGAIYARLTGTCSNIVFGIRGGNGGDVEGGTPHGTGGGGAGGRAMVQAGTVGNCVVDTSSGQSGITEGTQQPNGSGPPPGGGTSIGQEEPPPGGGFTNPPGPPTVTFPDPVSFPNDADLTQTPNIQGTRGVVPVGATIAVFVDGVEVCTAVVTTPTPGENGMVDWWCDPVTPLGAGNHVVYAAAKQAAVYGALSSAKTFNVQGLTWAQVVGPIADRDGEDVVVRWWTDLEDENLGFRVLRARGAEEPEEIGWVDATGSFSAYEWRDSPGDGEWLYWVEDLDFSGKATRHGPCAAVVGAGDVASGSDDGAATSLVTAFADAAPDVTVGPTVAEEDDRRWADPESLPGVRRIERDDAGVVYEITPPPFEAVPYGDRHWVRIAGWPNLGAVGNPSLPVLGIPLRVPSGMRPVLEVVAIDEVAHPDLEPLDTPPGTAAVFGTEVAAPALPFSRSATYPRTVVRLSEPGRIWGASLAAIVVTPVRWDAAARELRSASRVRVRVAFEPSPAVAVAPRTEEEIRQSRIVHQPSVVARVGGEGLVRISAAELAPLGAPPEDLAVYRRGVEVPALVDDGDLLFLASAAAESERLYASARAFWITRRIDAGSSEWSVDASAPAAGVAASEARLSRRFESDTFFGLFTAQGDGADRWYWKEAFNGSQTSVALDVPSSPSPAGGSIEVELAGLYLDPASPSGHTARLLLDGVELGMVEVPGSGRVRAAFALPPGLLAAGSNLLVLENTSAKPSRIAIDDVTLSWNGPANAVGANDLAATTLAAGSFTASGFATPPLFAVDETDPEAPIALAVDTAPDGAGGWLATVTVAADRRVRFVAAPVDADVRFREAGSALDSGTGADHVTISAATLLEAARGFAAYRESAAGGGFRSAVVAVEDVVDELAFGDADPAAVRAFLLRASREWPAPAPRYALLVGDSSIDARGVLAPPPATVLTDHAATSLVWAASDVMLAAYEPGDLLPDVAMGRVPARTPAEVENVLAKTIAHEAAPRDGWDRVQIFLADDDDPGFDDAAEAGARYVPHGMEAVHISGGDLGDLAARTALLDGSAEGAALVTYVGHGGVQTWGAEPYLGLADAGAIGSARHPVVASFDCLNALFDHPQGESIAESMIRAPGGPAAVWGPSAITSESSHRAFLEGFQAAFWRHPDRRIGDVVSDALSSAAWREDAGDASRTFLLFGDPALRHNVNRAPRSVARISSVGPMSAVLDASQSSDEDGDPLSFRWEVVDAPAGAFFSLGAVDSESVELASSMPGRFVVRVRAADEHLAGPADELVVELRAAPQGSGSVGGCSVVAATVRWNRGWILCALAAVAVAVRRRGSASRATRCPIEKPRA